MIVIADSGPLLHLFWVGALEWALPLQDIVVVEAVWREVEQYAPDALLNSRLRRFSESVPVPPALKARRLDSGEESALAYALAQADKTDLVLLCDDQKARKVCQAFALPITGTLGMIVAAVRLGQTTQETAITALNEMPGRGRFYVKPTLIAHAIALVKAESQP